MLSQGGKNMNNRTTYTQMLLAFASGLLLGLPSPLPASEGIAQGEHTDEIGQQGVGLEDTAREQGSGGPEYSTVIMGGPDIVVGQITQISGDQYSVSGDREEADVAAGPVHRPGHRVARRGGAVRTGGEGGDVDDGDGGQHGGPRRTPIRRRRPASGRS